MRETPAEKQRAFRHSETGSQGQSRVNFCLNSTTVTGKKTDPGGGSFGALILTVKGPTARVSFWEHLSGAFAHQHARRSASVRSSSHCQGPCSKDPPARVPRVCLCVARRPHGRDIGPHRAYSTTGRACLRSPCSRGSSGKIALPLTYICQGRRTPFLALFSKYKVIGPFGCAVIFGFPSGIIR